MTRFYTQVTCVLAIVFSQFAVGYSADSRTLRFYHTHTSDQLDVTYYRDGYYVPEAMDELRVFLADWRNGIQHEIDPELMDILWKIQQTTGNQGTFEVISAYRSEETNRQLRGKSKGVAQYSQHLLGKAIDVRLRGLDTRVLRDTALALELGGVGYYETTDFVHVDTGRVRRW